MTFGEVDEVDLASLVPGMDNRVAQAAVGE
jgi:hypothetical protein